MKKTFQNISSHLSTILSSALMLFLFGLIMTVLFAANSLSQRVQENIDISVYLKQNLTSIEADSLRAALLAMPAVKSAVFISKTQALEDAVKESNLKKNPEELLGYNPLFPMMAINLNAAFANNDSIASFETALKKNTDVVNVQYHPSVVETVNRNIARIMLLLSLFCAVFLFIVIVLINNMVRLYIYARRFLFNTMKLVGADRSFIVRAIVREQVINGAIAAVPAIAALLYMLHYLHRTMRANTTTAMIYIALLTLIVGMIVTGCAAYFATLRYLKRNTTDLYHS